MIYLKGIIIILIMFICNLIGNIKANSFEKRYLELRKIKNSLGVFRSKLEFTYEPINEIFNEISKVIYDNKTNVFKCFIENNDWNMAVDNQKDFLLEDKEIIKSFGKMLGKLDKTGQLNEINLVDSFLDKQIENAYEIKNKNKKLYKFLGKSVGIAIAIVLI